MKYIVQIVITKTFEAFDDIDARKRIKTTMAQLPHVKECFHKDYGYDVKLKVKEIGNGEPRSLLMKEGSE